MAEPTQADIAGFQSIGDIAHWVGVGDAERDALLADLGCVAGDNDRPVGAMPSLDFDAVVATLQVAGQPPVPFVLSGWRLIGRAARIAVGTDQTRAQIDAAAARLQAVVAAARPTGSASTNRYHEAQRHCGSRLGWRDTHGEGSGRGADVRDLHYEDG